MREDKNTEFKREYTDDIKYSIIAFANTDGGTIYIGINDDGSIRGADNPEATLLRITNMIRDAIRPDVTMFIDSRTEIMEEKSVIVLTVQRGTARPYYLYGKGVRPEGVYVRQGASSVPASETMILNMIKETGGDSYENTRSLNQQLTFSVAEQYFSKKGLEFGDPQKRTLQIIGSDGTYSNLGMLLSDQCVHTIKAAVFEGTQKSVFRHRKEFTGSVLQQMEESFRFIDEYNHIGSRIEGLERIDTRDYPVEAIREALLNSIVHRDYSLSSPTLISIFEDRIEFVNIGGLVRGITLEDIKLGVSVARNQRLADVFYRLRLIEAYGTGIMKINECYAEYDMEPIFEATDNAFKLTLPNVNYSMRSKETVERSSIRNEFSDDRERIIIEMLIDRTEITRRDVEKALNVSQGTASIILRSMIEKGLLVMEGRSKNTRYRLKKLR